MSDLFIFSVLILSTITAFAAGYGLGYIRSMNKKTSINIPTPKPSNWNSSGSDSSNSISPIQSEVKLKPTQSAVMKYPTPEEVRKGKDKDVAQDYWDHLAKTPRDKGTFKLEL